MATEVIQETTRPVFWEIGNTGKIIFYILSIITVLIFLYGITKKFLAYTKAEEDKIERLNNLPRRIWEGAKIAGSNSKQFYQDTQAGISHSFIMWGFLTLLVATTILFIDLDIARVIASSFFVGEFYLSYSLIVDFMGLLFVIGVSIALYKRYATRDSRLHHPHTSLEDDLFIWSLFILGITGYIIEGVRILGTGFPNFETVSFVGLGVAHLFEGLGMSQAIGQAIYPGLWWFHSIIALSFIALLPYAKPLHMLTSFANIVTSDKKSKRRLPGVPQDAGPEEIGYESIEDFSWKHLLDHDACTKCGRCTAVCPANASDRPLSPRDVILDLKKYREDRDENGEEISIIAADSESVIDRETMDACMACGACMDACPVEIEHIPQFVEMNRRIVESGQMEENLQETMMNIFQNGNPMGEPERKRPDWTEELDFEIKDAREEDVEWLWYVGDYPSFDDRNQRIAKSIANILENSDVSYGILYEDEKNDGNDVRRVGEEGLFEMLAEENIETFESANFEKVVCTDPHSYNTFKNEYSDFGWEGKIYHYTQLLEKLIENGDLKMENLDYKVTYHDPCHLGRINEEYEAPREVVEATGCTLYEMPRNRSNSFCCGGGGGGVWTEFDEDPKPSEERIREALEDTKAKDSIEKFIVACPQCTTMYEDGRITGGYEENIEVVDVSELVAEAVQEHKKVKS